MKFVDSDVWWTDYQELVNFATHWPNRYWALKGPRKEIEGVFGLTKETYGHQLTCQTKVARENEIIAKFLARNIRSLAFARHVTS